MINILLITFIIITNKVIATTESQSKKYSEQDVLKSLQTFNRQDVPGYTTDTPREANLNNSNALESAVGQNALNSEAAQLVQQSAQKRPYFALDVNQDPIVLNSQAAVQDPEKFLSQKKYSNRVSPQYEIKTCEESKPQTLYSCTKTLIEPTISFTPAKYSHYWCSGSAHHKPDDPNCRAKTYFNPAKKYEDEKIEITHEEWTNNCLTLEKWEKKGVCKLVKKTCPKGPETRDIVASVDGTGKPIVRSLKRDCWQYKNEYQCTYSAKNDCENLRRSSCEQIESTCLKSIGDTCVVWKQTFKCFKNIQDQNNQEEIIIDDMMPQLPDSSTHQAYQANNELGDAMAKLSIFNEIQQDLKDNQNQDQLPQIFKGKALKCVKKAVGFNDCCKLKGWGQKLHIAGCDGEARELAEQRTKGLCVATGSYKTGHKPLKKTYKSYCCFPTKLARILHEKGRAQLGIGWGTAETPECRGYNVTELSQLNFDGLDLSELYADIRSRVKISNPDIVKRNLSHRFNQIAGSLKNQPTQGDH